MKGLKMKKIISISSLLILNATAGAQTLEERVEALEYAGYENIFKFSGQLEMAYSTVTTEDKKNDTKASGQAWRSWLKLDMAAKPSDKMQFYGRLSMAKLMNRMSAYSDGSVGDINGQLEEGQGLKNSEVYVERAFINYYATDKLTFSMGRLPTANGTPYSLTRNESSGGAYPLLAYNAFFDGVALSYSVTPEFATKFVYTPLQFEMGSSATGTANTTTSGGSAKTPTDVFSILLDYDTTNMSWTRRFNLTFQFLNAKV